MGVISVPQASDGVTGVNAASVNNPVNTIAAEFNGNIDNANIKPAAAIATSKLATDAGITAGMLKFGKVRSRQGGSATDWNTTGVNTYDTSAADAFTQVGTIAAGASPQIITFPTPYVNKPLVMACTVALTANCYCTIPAASVTNTGFSVQVLTDAGVGNNAQAVNWIAIGV